MEFNIEKSFAVEMDKKDPLREFRKEFLIPKHSNGKDTIYFCGNSLGLQPVKAKPLMEKEFQSWADHGVEGHFKGSQWVRYHEKLSDMASKIVGAKINEVIIMNTLTVNLHLMMISFYRPSRERFKILVEKSSFPSDQYAIQSQVKLHGYDPEKAIIEIDHDNSIDTILSDQGESIALILLGGVNYYSGHVFDMKNITQKGHEKGCLVGFDLAHAFANIQLQLHDWKVDFAVWCTYKYGNGGPGSIAGCYINEKHAQNPNILRLAGWWGHDKDSRFLMGPNFKPILSAEGWQLSNPPIFSMTPLLISFEIILRASMDKMIQKSKLLTGYLDYLIKYEINSPDIFITPKNPDNRGCQISLHVKKHGKKLFDKLSTEGVICDWREPDVIRLAPVPLYNTFKDVFDFITILKKSISILKQ